MTNVLCKMSLFLPKNVTTDNNLRKKKSHFLSCFLNTSFIYDSKELLYMDEFAS